MEVQEQKWNGYHKAIVEQLDILEKILRKNHTLMRILENLEKDKTHLYYVGAGAINQTVFNYYHDYDVEYGIQDYDIVYYDEDVSYEAEDQVIRKMEESLRDISASLDIKNEARVPLWYYEKYGIQRVPYTSVEDAIASWGATVTCIGVRLEQGRFVVYAPYGLDDLFGMVIRPVKREFSKEAYDERAKRWMKKWPKLTKIEW